MNKLEECARAIFDVGFPNSSIPFEKRPLGAQKNILESARAVIRCLMEPSEGMVAAGGAEIYGHPREKAEEWAKEEKFDSCAYQATDTLRAMLQSVLDENKE